MTHTPWAELIPLPQLNVGKVRHMFEIPNHDNHLLMVASDRISTHNVIHETEIQGKGENLTALTVFWAKTVLTGKVRTHIEASGKDIYDYFDIKLPENLHRRAVVIKKCEVPKVEFVWRSYLTGSLYKDYQKGLDPYGLHLPSGLTKMHHFEKELFTPTEKSDQDLPLNSRYVVKMYPRETATTRKARRLIAQYLASRGIVLVDDKSEASRNMLVDEFGTGDCCRMAYAIDLAHAAQYGEEVAWLDKQVARDIAESLWDDKERCPLTFTPEQVERIIARYEEAFTAITDSSLSVWQARNLD